MNSLEEISTCHFSLFTDKLGVFVQHSASYMDEDQDHASTVQVRFRLFTTIRHSARSPEVYMEHEL